MSSLFKLNPERKPAFDGPKIAKQLVMKVAEHLPVLQAYLFGSSARGQNNENSDLDILLVVPDGSNLKEYHRIVGQAFFSPVAVDWIIKTKKDFEVAKNIGGISMIAEQEGISLFDGAK